MKYMLTVLLLVTCALADSFKVNLQQDAYHTKPSTSWTGTSGAQGALTSQSVNTTADSIVIATGYIDAATDSFKVWRGHMITDTLNTNAYLDSFSVQSGYIATFDSLEVTATVKNAVDSGGCTGYIYMYVLLNCNISQNAPASAFATSAFNDYRVPPGGFVSYLADSVLIDTTAFGMGDQATVTFALSDRTALDVLKCHFSRSQATAEGVFIFFVSCFDKTATQPTVLGGPYLSKVTMNSLDHATSGFRPTAKIYFREVSTNTELPYWRKGWDSWRTW